MPEQVLAWQLEGVSREEIQDEVRTRGLTEYPEIALLSALSAAGADQETIRVLRKANEPRKVWQLKLRVPSPTDYLYEISGAILWNDRDAALAAIQREAEKQPHNANVHLIYANSARYEGDWIRAYAEATVAVQLAPDSPYGHGLRSTICYHARLAHCALREAATFVAMRPHDAGAYIVLGHAQELQGNHAESLQAYKAAEKLYAGYSAIYEGMGRMYGATAEFEQAVRAFEHAIQMEKGNAPEYSCELAEVYLAEGYARKAVETLRMAKKQNANNVELELALGRAYLADEQYDAAIRELHDVLGNAPDDQTARDLLEKLLLARGYSGEAAQSYMDSDASIPPKPQQ